MKPVISFNLFFLLFFPSLILAQDTDPSLPSSPDSPYSIRSSDNHWQVGASVTYQTGEFDTNTRTNTTYIPITLKRYFEKGEISGTLPFIHQESGPGVTAITGRPFRTGPAVGAKRTDSGLGDIVLKGGYYLITEPEQTFNLSPVASIKFPTADEDKGLGTGEFDQTIGLESAKSFNEKWNGYLDFYYTFIGDPPGNNLDNQFTFIIGPGYKVSSSTHVGLSYQESTALTDGRPNPRDLLWKVSHKMDDSVSLLAGTSVGLSEGSPDFGITAGADLKF